MTIKNRGHGSPWDRGAADAYYKRRMNPHKIVDGKSIALTDVAEIAEYYSGAKNNPDGEKVY